VRLSRRVWLSDGATVFPLSTPSATRGLANLRRDVRPVRTRSDVRSHQITNHEKGASSCPHPCGRRRPAILHAYRQVAPFWRAAYLSFQPSERPASGSRVDGTITRCGVGGLVCVADRSSCRPAVATGSVSTLAAVVAVVFVPSAGFPMPCPGSLVRRPLAHRRRVPLVAGWLLFRCRPGWADEHCGGGGGRRGGSVPAAVRPAVDGAVGVLSNAGRAARSCSYRRRRSGCRRRRADSRSTATRGCRRGTGCREAGCTSRAGTTGPVRGRSTRRRSRCPGAGHLFPCRPGIEYLMRRTGLCKRRGVPLAGCCGDGLLGGSPRAPGWAAGSGLASEVRADGAAGDGPALGSVRCAARGAGLHPGSGRDLRGGPGADGEAGGEGKPQSPQASKNAPPKQSSKASKRVPATGAQGAGTGAEEDGFQRWPCTPNAGWYLNVPTTGSYPNPSEASSQAAAQVAPRRRPAWAAEGQPGRAAVAAGR